MIMSSFQELLTDFSYHRELSRLFTCSLDCHVKVHDLGSFSVAHSIKYPSPILSMGISVLKEFACQEIKIQKEDAALLAVGMVDGLLSIRQRVVTSKDAYASQQRKKRMPMRAGTVRYYMRGQTVDPLKVTSRKLQNLTFKERCGLSYEKEKEIAGL